MTRYGEIPDTILRNAELRLSAHRPVRLCIHCPELATHSNCNGQDRCETHRLTPPVPTPDPARTLAGLQEQARREGRLPASQETP